MPRHDAHHRLAGADGAGAVGPGQGHALFPLVAAHVALDAHHVLRRDAVGDADAKANTGIGGFHDRVRCKRRRHEHDAGLGAGLAHRVLDGVEHRPLEVTLATLARRHAADHVGAVIDHFLRMKGADAAGEALHDNSRGLV
jgi:hypothetical protein